MTDAAFHPFTGTPLAQRVWLDTYIAAFNAGDLDGFLRFYHDDVHFDLTVAPPLTDKAALRDFYRGIFDVIRETVTFETVEITPDTINATISVLFTARKDAPDFVLRPLIAGEQMTARFAIVYRLREGRFSAVKVTPLEN